MLMYNMWEIWCWYHCRWCLKKKIECALTCNETSFYMWQCKLNFIGNLISLKLHFINQIIEKYFQSIKWTILSENRDICFRSCLFSLPMFAVYFTNPLLDSLHLVRELAFRIYAINFWEKIKISLSWKTFKVEVKQRFYQLG